MRILMLGDQASVAIQLSKELARQGDDVWILLPPLQIYRRRLGRDLGEIEVIWTKDTSLTRVLASCVEFSRKLGIDVLHSHWIRSFGLVASTTSILVDAVHVVHLHGTEIRDARNDFISELRTRLGAVRSNLFLFSTPDLKESYFFRCESDYLPSPIDLSSFRRRSDAEGLREKLASGRDHVVLCPARVDFERKNQDMLARAVSGREFEDTQTVFVSGVETRQMADLKRLVRELGIDDRVSFITGVPHESMPLYYSSADAVALSFKKGVYGCAILESLACETPVVSHFDHLRYGRYVRKRPPLIEASSVSEISASLRILFDDVKLRRVLGKKSRVWVEGNHSVQVVVRRLRSRYAAALGLRGMGTR